MEVSEFHYCRPQEVISPFIVHWGSGFDSNFILFCNCTYELATEAFVTDEALHFVVTQPSNLTVFADSTQWLCDVTRNDC